MSNIYFGPDSVVANAFVVGLSTTVGDLAGGASPGDHFGATSPVVIEIGEPPESGELGH